MDSLIAALSVHSVVGLDTALFIYLWERHAVYFPLVEALFRHFDEHQTRLVTSTITLVEVCTLPFRLGRYDLVHMYEQVLTNAEQLTLCPVDVTVARRAAMLRAEYNLRTPDALQLATALEHHATAFLTNDRRLSIVQNPSVFVLEEYLN